MSNKKQEPGNRKRRIFIAIDFPSQIKEKLLEFQKEWPKLPVRWTPEENLHLTLLFLGPVAQAQLQKIFEVSQRIAREVEPFALGFERIILGPPAKTPRMFWVELEKNQELATLQQRLKQELAKIIILRSRASPAEFTPHITLGRIKTGEWRQLVKKPLVDKPLSLETRVDSFKIMESQLEPTGAQHSTLKSFPLGLAVYLTPVL